MPTWTNANKSTTPAWLAYLRHGVDPLVRDMADFTFESVIFPDGTILKNATFNDLAAIVWANVSKSATPTWTQPSQS